MKERLLDVVKWGLIIILAGAVFYLVCPKYYFFTAAAHIARGNRITGTTELYTRAGWERLGAHGFVAPTGGRHD